MASDLTVAEILAGLNNPSMQEHKTLLLQLLANAVVETCDSEETQAVIDFVVPSVVGVFKHPLIGAGKTPAGPSDSRIELAQVVFRFGGSADEAVELDVLLSTLANSTRTPEQALQLLNVLTKVENEAAVASLLNEFFSFSSVSASGREPGSGAVDDDDNDDEEEEDMEGFDSLNKLAYVLVNLTGTSEGKDWLLRPSAGIVSRILDQVYIYVCVCM